MIADWSRLSYNVLEVIFSYLSLSDLRSCFTVCSRWYTYLSWEDNEVWRMHLQRRLSEEVINSEELASVYSSYAKLRAHFHAWNPKDCSKHAYIKASGFTLHRNPVAQSTDGVRGKLGFTAGR